MLSIQKAEYIDDYKIHLLFNNGRTGTANLEQTIFDDNRAVFQTLRNKQSFREFKLAHSTVVWLNELDLAPEYLFYLAFMKDNEFQEQFRQWGYIS